MLVSPLHPSFLDTYSLSTSSLGYKALCVVIRFLSLLSIYLSYFLVHFKNGPEYLTRDTDQAFIAFISFRLYSLVLSSFLVLLRYSFLIFFFHLSLFDGVCFHYSQVFVRFLFSERSNFFSFWFFHSFRHVSSLTFYY